MSYQPIENYGIIGNMRTVALVGMNGSIDWYCYPHFDSPSIFGAILDDKKGGRFQISADADGVRHKQFYWPSTNVLVTRFLLKDGIVELEDFMPVGLPSDSPEYHHVYRRVRCVRGAVRIWVACRPAFDYGRQIHQTLIEANGAIFKAGSLTLTLATTAPLRDDGQGGVSAEFVLAEGKLQLFVLGENCTDGGVPCRPSEKAAEELLQRTVKFWQDWLSACSYHGRWRDQVQRSALALKLLTFEPTGAIIAAPTTSLPEVIGGARNWDYRYTWMRDAAFTVYAFLRIGFRDEAAAFMRWIEDYASKHVPSEGARGSRLHDRGRQPAFRADVGSLGRVSRISTRPHRQCSGLAVPGRHLRRADGRVLSIQQVRQAHLLRCLGKDPQSSGVDLRELAAS